MSYPRSARLMKRSIVIPLGMVFVIFVTLQPTKADTIRKLFPTAVPTLGGKQFWADQVVRHGWRIQENILTGHYRLLDSQDRRHAWGEFKSVHDRFIKLRRNNLVTPPLGTGNDVVLLIHGALRSAGSFATLKDALINDGFDATAISYPSTRRNIAAQADQIEGILDTMSLDEIAKVKRISFVTHSMGGLILRELLSRDGVWRKSLEVGRVVMIAPPNQGSSLAHGLKDNGAFRFLYGPAGQELIPEAARSLPHLAAEFSVIAGGKSDRDGYNPFLPGDDDGVVRVTETPLHGMSSFLMIRALHGTILNHPATVQATINFLRHGKF